MTDNTSTNCPECGAPRVSDQPCPSCANIEPKNEDTVEQVLNEREGEQGVPSDQIAASSESEQSANELEGDAVVAEVIGGEHLTPIVATQAAPDSSAEDETGTDGTVEAEVVECELVEGPETAGAQTRAAGVRSPFSPDYNLERRSKRTEFTDERREYLSAKGGSVGAIALGIIAIPGAILTPASAITALLGIGMGIWGMLSTYRKMAMIGIALCMIALTLCLLRGPLGFSDWF